MKHVFDLGEEMQQPTLLAYRIILLACIFSGIRKYFSKSVIISNFFKTEMAHDRDDCAADRDVLAIAMVYSYRPGRRSVGRLSYFCGRDDDRSACLLLGRALAAQKNAGGIA